ncbi:MAG: hypothetical protein DRJ42_19010 [Deltaproteobacteria bacterium]|nr:MAG: hypothetical protein DRJ42_19010 [Deltaproteobacteria bacterium]
MPPITPIDTPSAIAALDADELRDLVVAILPALGPADRASVIQRAMDVAARGRSGWSPTTLTRQSFRELLGFAAAAERIGWAEPSGV